MLTAEQEQMRRSEPEMQIALRRAKPHSKVVGHSATCPSPDHDDKTPSGSYKTSEDGFVHFCCHACNWHGDVFDVLAVSSGRSVEQVLADYRDRPNRPAATAPSAGVPKAARTFTNYEQLRGVKDAEEQRRFNATFEAAHFYENPNTGRADLLILRYRKPPEEGQAKGKKDMPQFHERPDGVFVEGKPAGLQPMYRRKENRGAKSIIALEGEVKVDTLLAIGFNATCWPGGCGAVGQADIGWLDGAERVTLWPDNDDNGRLAMKKFAARLQEFPHPPEIAWINPADFDLAEGEDVVDLARQCERAGVDAKQTIADAIEHAKVSSLSEGLRRRFKEIIAGTWYALAFPFPLLSKGSKALLPQNVCIVGGRPGAVKSFLILWILLYWFRVGVRFAYLTLEEDRVFVNWRLIAMLEHNGNLLDDEWIKEHPDEARAAEERHRGTLDRFNRFVWERPGEQVELGWVSDWVRNRARDGYRVIVVDPVTVCRPAAKTYMADHDFVTSIEFTLATANASVVLVTHCAKGAMALDMDSIAGGSAYQKLCQCLLLLERHNPAKKATMRRPDLDAGRFECEIDETIHILKSRKGGGMGTSIGYKIDWAMMEFSEQGVILKKESKRAES